MLTKWLGIIEASVSLGGLAGLVTGMHKLATSPLLGATMMLASMTLVLNLLAKLSQAQEVRQETRMKTDARVQRCSRSAPLVPGL